MQKIIIDCDPGHDDAVALFMAAASPDISEIVLTTVVGNNTVQNSTRNARMTAEVLGIRPTIAQGMSHPLVTPPIISDEFHGTTGMDGPTGFPEPTLPVESLHAVEVMRNVLAQSEEPVPIVALAPLTNLAILLRMYPELACKIKVISLMGGGLDHGNSSPHAEFNIFVDPEAAQIVFNSGVPVVMAGLDLTEQVCIYPEEFSPLRLQSPAGKFFCELMDFYVQSAHKFGADGCVMHDPCAMAWLLEPGYFEGTRGQVNVVLAGEERGRTVLTPREDGSVLVLTGGKTEKAAQLILDLVHKACAPQS